MALEGASANLGPESREWVTILERLVIEQGKAIEQLQGELQAVSGR